MTLETSEKDYDADMAQEILQSCGELAVAQGLEAMHMQNLITKVVSNPHKRVPGRSWRFQDWQVSQMCLET